MSRALRAVLCLWSIAILSGCTDRGRLITLVQRVALTPGVDALDPIDPVPVGQDLESIEFFLTEPLTQASAESFDPSVHLSLGGLALHPTNPFFFNTANEGTIPPYAHLTVNLAVGSSGIAEGSYRVSLISPDGNRLKSPTVDYLGDFTFRIAVVARDGKLPYIVRFTPQQMAEVPEEIPPGAWMLLAGVIPHGERISPHAPLRAEFSERMRTPLTVGGGPEVLVEKLLDTSFGQRRVLLPEIIGVDFQSTIQPVTWDDTVDDLRSELVTVMTSETVEGLEIATDYRLEFPGAGPLTSMQPGVKDRSGEALTFRFAEDEVARQIAITDRRGFTTAPIRINTPDHRGHLNANAFLAGDVSLAFDGEVADFVDPLASIAQVNLSLLAPGGGVVSATSVTPFVTDEFNLTGVAIDRYQGLLAFPASGSDGEYELRADAVAGDGSAHGADTIRLIKDTVAPALFGGTELQIRADEHEVVGLCVVASPDTVSAELFLAGTSLATSTAFSEVFLASPFGVFRRFCFDPFPLLGAFHGGVNRLSVRLVDEAGNESLLADAFILRVQPVLLSVFPAVAEPEDSINVLGFGLETLGASTDFMRFSGSRVRLDHGVNRDGSGPAVFQFVLPGSNIHDPDMVEIRVPHFASTGTLEFEVDGVRSTTLVLEICQEVLLGPFVTDALASDSVLLPEEEAFVGDIALSGILTNPDSLPGEPDVTTAGRPLLFAPSTFGRLLAWELFETGWIESIVRDVNLDDLGRGVAAARGPDGDVAVAYVVHDDASDDWRAEIASRAIQGTAGIVSWTHQVVARVPEASTGSFPPPAVALAYSDDGRGAVVFAAPVEAGLWAAVQTSPTSAFRSILVDGRSGAAGAVSAAFDAAGTLWIAYSRDLTHYVPEGSEARIEPFEMDIVRIPLSSAGPIVERFTSPMPRRGLWPSIAIDPTNGLPAVAFQEASFVVVVDLPPIPWPPTGAEHYVVGQQRFARWTGDSWTLEAVDDRPRRVLGFSDDNPVTANLNLRSPRTVLRFSPDGTARIGYASLDGGVFVASKPAAASSWSIDVADVTPGPGPSFAFTLNAAGRAFLGYHDKRLNHLRLFEEEEGRAVADASSVDDPPCEKDAYRRSSIVADFETVLDDHDDFRLSVGPSGTGTLFQLGDPSAQLDFLVTAVEHDRISLEARSRTVGGVQQADFRAFEYLDPDPPGLTGPALPVDRLDVSFFSGSLGDIGRPFGRVRVRPRFLVDADQNPELQLSLLQRLDPDVIVGCCANQTTDPLACDHTQAGVNNCISILGAPLSLCTNAAGDPGPCRIHGLGPSIERLERSLPLLPAAAEIDFPGFEGFLSHVKFVFDATGNRDVEILRTGADLGPGSATLRLRASDYQARVTNVHGINNFPDECESFNMDIFPLDLSFPKLEGEGPIGTASRDGSHRFGIPLLAAPRGRFVVSEGSLGVDINGVPGNDLCPPYIGSFQFGSGLFGGKTIEERIRKAFADPPKDLRPALDGMAGGLSRALVTPLLEELLGRSVPVPVPGAPQVGNPTHAVTLRLGTDGVLRSIFEKPEAQPVATGP